MGSLRFVKDEVTAENGMVTASTPPSAEAGLRGGVDLYRRSTALGL